MSTFLFSLLFAYTNFFCFTAAIKAGYYDVGIAAGVETMTSNPMKWEGGMNPRVASSSDAQSCLIPMGVTSENIAEKWCVFIFVLSYAQLD